jgi:hypothetical protein
LARRQRLLYLPGERVPELRHLSHIDEARVRRALELRLPDEGPAPLTRITSELRDELATKSERASYLEWLLQGKICLSGGVGDIGWSLRFDGRRFLYENADGARELPRAQVEEMIAQDRYGWVYFKV